jgi:hypothetical protein
MGYEHEFWVNIGYINTQRRYSENIRCDPTSLHQSMASFFNTNILLRHGLVAPFFEYFGEGRLPNLKGKKSETDAHKISGGMYYSISSSCWRYIGF